MALRPLLALLLVPAFAVAAPATVATIDSPDKILHVALNAVGPA